MRGLLWLLGLFALAAALAVAGRYNEGYALLVWPPYRLQISLNLLILLLVGGFVALYTLSRVVARTMALPRAVQRYRERKSRERASQAIYDTVRLRIEGRFGQALKQATAAYEAGESPGLAALLAARAAHSLRDETRYRFWLGKAAEHDGEMRLARLMTEAKLAVEERRFDEAAERIADLQAGGQRHIAALRLALRTAQAKGNWSEAVRVVRQLVKVKALTAAQADPVKRRAHQEGLRQRAGDSLALMAYWNEVPRDEQRDARLVGELARALIAAGDSAAAQKAIESQLALGWDSALADIYGRCEGGDVRGRLAKAEEWLKREPRDPLLLLTLGRLCVQSQLWGKAESYLDASLAIAPGWEAHVELAHLAERIGRTDDANVHYRAAAELSRR
ncbi:MAG TPA: heme biosynthesis HemY N-terminal domain-containing protein [Zoogloea sp.]|uniref:heme biosynthesis HemY N-terminal domain-containing protein n=1 Tax=Zoogloea sp. TaxID=49181 RepID=UPI001B70E530|nr:heme biosynthesis HemY N-terminal domain-containing protein [Zoogloea sp.]MBP8264938.1 heme biosynthesis protein HemY [Zoogloea sp.]HOB46490.1 heme biosynthesis HemY N-terminal domain-containing protein [Zoogloea sp.]HQA11106.1 heme biosynthesis HemY N-terminal domain-containing protein [Zoogloea sp.]HQE39625.1 heme biosynthesis HemY N-terminal domain-containing protein [Zoogloea sp.]